MSYLAAHLLASGFALNPGSWGVLEFGILFAIILIFFGPKRLPQLSRSIGKAIRDFKRGLNDIHSDIERAGDDDEDQEGEEADKPAPSVEPPMAREDAPRKIAEESDKSA